MNGTFAQLAALTCHANTAIAGETVPEFLPGNSTSRYCESITYAVEEQVVAATPNAWFQHLREAGVRGVRFVHEPSEKPQIPDYMSSGFVGGGGPTVIAARREGKFDLWGAGWKHLGPNAPDRKVWAVRYERFATIDELLAQPAPEQAATALASALECVLDYTNRQRGGVFADHFTRALEHLAGTSSATVFHEDLYVAGTLPEHCVRLLKACEASWVFGGMGWWNDRQPGEGTRTGEYEEVTTSLYAALLDGTAAGVNQTDRG